MWTKYRNKVTFYNGQRYDSKKEATRAMELDILKRAGEIEGYQRQVRFPIQVNNQHICAYIADFVVQGKGKQWVEDVKGVETPVFKLKRKLMKAVHGIEIINPYEQS